MSVKDTCDTFPNLNDFCEIKPKNIHFAPFTSDFSILVFISSTVILTGNMVEV